MIVRAGAAFILILLAAVTERASAAPPCPSFGRFVAQWDDLSRPVAVAVAPDGRVAVAEADAHRIRFVDPTGTKTAELLELPGRGLRGLAIAPSGRLAVLLPREVLVWESASAAARPDAVHWQLDDADAAALAWRGEELLIADRACRCVRIVGPDGVERGRLTGSLARPAGVAVDAAGGVVVADGDLHAIVRFDASGREVARFGDRGAFPGLFNAPAGVALLGDCLYVADELNHRIAISDGRNAASGQWGMHAVVPREGEGKIHYPVSIAFSADGAFAFVAEPFEHRVQVFGRSTPEALTRASLPSREGVQSHFGSAVASDGDLLILGEPESSSLFVFDLRTPTPVHVSSFGGAGTGRDRFGRVSAIDVDASTQRVFVADPGLGRLALFELARDRDKPLAMDPFMPRLVRTADLAAWSASALRLAGLDEAGGPLEPVAFARTAQGRAVLDRRRGLIVMIDERLQPRAAIATGLVGGTGLVALTGADSEGGFAIALPEDGVIAFVDAEGRVLRRSTGPTDEPFVRPTSLARAASGDLIVTDAGGDRLVVLSADGTPTGSIGGRGGSDGELWAPDGVAVLASGAWLVVDRGNHRAQVFKPDGGWTMTFGLGRAYTRPRERGAS